MWDQRYNTPDFIYGEEPNDFLRANVSLLTPGAVLCLAEGEGRNGVFLARQGFEVTAVDSSQVGLKKAESLASSHQVRLCTVVADLAEYTIPPQHFDTIVSIFCHLPPVVRARVHQATVAGLKPGGTLILEAYTPKQLEYKTGGPPAKEMMMSLGVLESELAGLHFIIAQEIEREVIEGSLHTGMGAVVQILAKKM